MTPPRAPLEPLVGAPPGLLIDDPSADEPAIQAIVYDHAEFEEVALNIGQLAELLEAHPPNDAGEVLWVDVNGTRDADTVRTIGELFGLHPLALEDVNNGGQRPKVDDYESHLFVVARLVVDSEELETEQLSIFVGRGHIVTFQERAGDCFENVRERVRRGRGRIRQSEADYLAYALLDAIIDHFGPVIDGYGDRLDELERQALRGTERGAIPALMDTRHELHSLKRVAMGSRSMLDKLLDRKLELISPDTRTYLRDCHDHAVQLVETIESWREFGANLVDVHLTVAGQELNEVMKVLTIIATIFIPLSFITGIYGMNFERANSPLNMPELGWYFGYPFALTLMIVVVAIQVFYFRRKGWLRSS